VLRIYKTKTIKNLQVKPNALERPMGGLSVQNDPDLAYFIKVWPSLQDTIKQDILNPTTTLPEEHPVNPGQSDTPPRPPRRRTQLWVTIDPFMEMSDTQSKKWRIMSLSKAKKKN
jgi:hypothetical protein